MEYTNMTKNKRGISTKVKHSRKSYHEFKLKIVTSRKLVKYISKAYSTALVCGQQLPLRHTADAGRGHLLWLLRQTKNFPYHRSLL